MLAAFWGQALATVPRDLKGLRLDVCDSKRNALLVVEVDGLARGLLGVGVRPWSDAGASAPIPHVEAWYVEPGWRGRGLGRALMTAAEAWAVGQGFSELGSDTTAGNRGSLAAHRAAGFEVAERVIFLIKRLPRP